MDPTLTLTIPLTLLSRIDVLDPSTHFPIADRPTLPLTYLHATLTKYCPAIPIHLHIPPTSSGEEQSEKGNEEAREETESWILAPSPPPTSPAPCKKDANTNTNTYATAYTLKRTCIPLATTSLSYRTFVAEIAALFQLVHAMHALRGPWASIATNRDIRLWSIVALPNTALELSVRASVSDVDAEVVKKLVMLVAGVEREIVGCSLLGRGVSSLVERIVVRGASEIGDLEGRIRRTRGRRGEWFDIVNSMDSKTLLRGIGNAGDGIGIKCEVNDGGSLGSLSLRMQASTCEVEEILWYTALGTGLMGIACERDGEGCVEWLEGYRENAPSPICPVEGLEYLAKELRLPAPPKSYLPDPNAEFEMGEEEDALTNPFWKFETNVEKERVRQRAYIPVFMERYEEAGGFWPTNASKIEALRAVEGWRKIKEDNDRKKTGRSARVGVKYVEEVQVDSEGDGAETLEVGERGGGLAARVMEGLRR
jgi:hypothetical protein